MTLASIYRFHITSILLNSSLKIASFSSQDLLSDTCFLPLHGCILFSMSAPTSPQYFHVPFPVVICSAAAAPQMLLHQGKSPKLSSLLRMATKNTLPVAAFFPCRSRQAPTLNLLARRQQRWYFQGMDVGTWWCIKTVGPWHPRTILGHTQTTLFVKRKSKYLRENAWS